MKKVLSILIALVMLLTAFAAAAETVPEPDYTTGTPWLYVDLIGNVTKETETNLKDNFALAANKEKLLKLEFPAGFEFRSLNGRLKPLERASFSLSR